MKDTIHNKKDLTNLFYKFIVDGYFVNLDEDDEPDQTHYADSFDFYIQLECYNYAKIRQIVKNDLSHFVYLSTINFHGAYLDIKNKELYNFAVKQVRKLKLKEIIK